MPPCRKRSQQQEYLFSSELEKLHEKYVETSLIFDNIPDLLIAPVISGSAHFQILKHLDYVEIEIDEETEEEYFEIM